MSRLLNVECGPRTPPPQREQPPVFAVCGLVMYPHPSLTDRHPCVGSIPGVPPQPSVRPHDAGADWQPGRQQHVPACVPVDAVLLGKDQWLLHVGPLVRGRCCCWDSCCWLNKPHVHEGKGILSGGAVGDATPVISRSPPHIAFAPSCVADLAANPILCQGILWATASTD